jgi:tryptophan-rich sensory protein
VLALLGALAALIVWQVEPGSQPLLLGLAALGLGVALLWSLPFIYEDHPRVFLALVALGFLAVWIF